MQIYKQLDLLYEKTQKNIYVFYVNFKGDILVHEAFRNKRLLNYKSCNSTLVVSYISP